MRCEGAGWRVRRRRRPAPSEGRARGGRGRGRAPGQEAAKAGAGRALGGEPGPGDQQGGRRGRGATGGADLTGGEQQDEGVASGGADRRPLGREPAPRAADPVRERPCVSRRAAGRGAGRGGARAPRLAPRTGARTPPPGSRARTDWAGSWAGRNTRARHVSSAPPEGRGGSPRGSAGQRPAAPRAPWSAARDGDGRQALPTVSAWGPARIRSRSLGVIKHTPHPVTRN